MCESVSLHAMTLVLRRRFWHLEIFAEAVKWAIMFYQGTLCAYPGDNETGDWSKINFI